MLHSVEQSPGTTVNRFALLDHAAVNSVWCHVTWLIKEPESFPFLYKRTKIFRGVDHLLGSLGWVG
jgi:hypothetical protein